MQTDPQADSPYAAARLMVTLLLMTLGASGMYVVPVVLPAVQAEFGIARAYASLPHSALLIGFGIGGLLMGRLADRFGVMVPLLLGAACLGTGFVVAANGAQMLSIMLAFGIVSRLVSGAICDRIGGLRTLLLGSALQGVALLLFLPFQGLASLYVIAALFGLFQGGIVPSYAIIVREHFPAARAGAFVGAVIMCTMLGMALGGWMSGRIFDLTGSYRAAFVNGLAWNALNLAIAYYLLRRTRGPGPREYSEGDGMPCATAPRARA